KLIATGRVGRSTSERACLGRLRLVSTHHRSAVGLVAIRAAGSSPADSLIMNSRAASPCARFAPARVPAPAVEVTRSPRRSPRGGCARSSGAAQMPCDSCAFQAAHHPMGKGLGLAFSVSPEKVVGEFVIYHLHPHPLALVDAPALPVLGMDEVDAAVLEGLTRGLAPIDVLVPFDARAFDVVVTAEFGYSAPKVGFAMVVEEADQFAVHLAAPDDRRNKHSHGQSSLDLISIESRWRGSQSKRLR